MPTEGDQAPTFTATEGTSDHNPFALEETLGDGPVVLAFFPGAFTPPCTNEMVTLQDHIDTFRQRDATVIGISADSPFTLDAFREAHGLEFDLVSAMSREPLRAYELEIDLPDLGLYGVANRAIYVLDEDGIIRYRWTATDPTNEPAYDEVLAAVDGL
ncbi:MAG: redoxin domain-containing protein [Halobacteriaceae archaeon]